MGCMTLTAQHITTTTTQFTRAVCSQTGRPVEERFVPQCRPLRVNWVVVTDENGKRRLQMGWQADRTDRTRSAIANSL
ncbi:MAG TPA: hypothetical protein VEF05_11885 [Terriglobales bacterium]|nr:hypothetical protein [Terriglobales bacterium]